MPSPFPGMDPYLEGPNFWPEVQSLVDQPPSRIISPAVAT